MSLAAALLGSEIDRGIRFLDGTGKEHYVAYRALLHRARRVLLRLQAHAVAAGDEIVLQVEDPEAFLTLFWACLLGRICPVPVQVGSVDEHRLKPFKIWSQLRRPFLVSDAATTTALRAFAQRRGLAGVWRSMEQRRAAAEDLLDGAAGRPDAADDAHDAHDADDAGVAEVASASMRDVAFVQFSSGSTGDPRGVVLTHGQVLDHLRRFARSAGIGAADSFLSWFPLTHDMGLIGWHLLPLVCGAEQAIMPTRTFVRQPLLWLTKASQHRSTVLSTQNFGLRHSLAALAGGVPAGLDLSAVRLLFHGSEPISAELCARFAERLRPCGLAPSALFPGYGLAEATLAVTFPAPGEELRVHRLDRRSLGLGDAVRACAADGAGVDFVEVGRPVDGTEVRIVDTAGTPLAASTIGLIEVRSPDAAAGYYEDPQATAALWSPGGWLKTGDLGFLAGDRLVVTGRAKELIVLNGFNYYPHDLERVAEELAGLAPGRTVACGVRDPSGGREMLVLFHHPGGHGEDLESLGRRLKAHMLRRAGVEVAHLLAIRRIPRTTSGKPRRLELAQRFLAGDFDAEIGRAADRDRASHDRPLIEIGSLPRLDRSARLTAWLLHAAADLIGEGLPHVERSLFEQGLDSVKALALQARLCSALGRELPVTLVFDHPSIAALGEVLLADAVRPAGGWPKAAERGRPPAPAGPPAPTGLPIAVIGLGCRLPGKVSDPASYWELLSQGRDAVGPIPAERWNAAALYDPDPRAAGRITSVHGGFLEAIDRFDPEFFGISMREAEALDPQARLLLEVSWETLERAGMDLRALRRSDTGVFVGIANADYSRAHFHSGDLQRIDAYSYTGTAAAAAAGRIAHVLGFHGPAVALDTACSSSLVAVHLAAQSLAAGDCDLALAGGVNLILTPDGHVCISRLGALSQRGRCRAFDDGADGYVRSEGCGVVLLKRLGEALADGDPVLAVIRGSAVNHDGASAGLTVPSGPAQQQVVRKALLRAGLAPAAIDYVEAHGTGTPLGDPIELQALDAVFGPRPQGAKLRVGSVKSNLGHLESAAGIAGLIKVVLALEHGEIPPSLHFETPSRHLRWPELCLEVAGRASAWTPGAAPRRAGVSSFGITGTNAHVVLEEAPPATAAGRRPAPDGGACRLAPPHLVPLSARSGGALAAWAGELRGVLAGRPELPLSDLSYTTSLRRTHLERRAVAIAGSHAELLDALAALAAGRTAPGLVCGRSRGDRKPRLAFVYSGQGGPPWALSPALAEAEPAFREAVAECERELCRLGLPPLAPALLAGAPDPGLARTDVAQPALFAVQVGLTALLAHYGIRPDAVVGHSCGELAAAWASGAVSLQQALGAVFHRGRLMQSAAGRGRMAAVSLPEAAVADRLRAYGGRVAIAALNSPTSTIVSGEPAAIDAVVRRLRDEGIACRHLAVDFAFHGPQMAAAAAELTELLADLPLDAGLARVPIYSTVRAARLAGPELGPAYWGDNVRQTVRFAAAVEQLAAEGVTHFLELAPVPVLQVPLRECLDGRRGEPAGSESAGDGTAVLSVLQRSRGDRRALLETLAILHCEGYDWDWRRLHPQPGRLVALPSYAWQRRRCWIDGFPARPEGGSAAAATAQPPAAADPGAGAAAYLVAWQPLAPAVAEPAAAGGSRRPGEPWLVLANPASPTARTLQQRLVAAGRECLTVPPGQGDLARLVGGAAELAGVLFLWGCDETRAAAAGGGAAATAAAGCDAAVTAEALRSSREGALAGAVELVQALASRAWRRPPRLWMVTCGAQQAVPEDRALDLPHAGLWGLGRVIANEHPELRCTRVDLAACPAAAEIDHLAALLLDDGAAPVAAAQGPAAPPERVFEPELALRGHAVLGARLHRPAALAPVRPLPVRAEASYLIAGGCGALGLQIAAWLVARGARTLCLLGRRGAAPAAAVPALEALRRRGARIELVACDLADSVQVARALREVGDRLPPLAGVVHAAGVLEDATLARLRRDSLDRVAAPKVEGAWNLHASTRHLDLDFFVLISSAAALLGAPGQAAYVAANSFLDALARHRAALGLPSLSIALGPVTLGAGGPGPAAAGPAAAGPAAAEPAGAGMAAALAANRLDDQGLGWLTAADLTAGLESLWQAGMPHLGLLRFDAPRWLDRHPAASASYLSALLPGGAGTRGRVGNAGSAGPAGDIGSLAADPPPLLLALTALAGHPDRLRSAVAAELLDILSQVSKTPVEEIDPEAPLRELGIDSLMTLAIRDHIARRFGSVVPATSFWAHPTVSRYARYLIAELQLDRPDATATAGAAAAAADDSGSWKGLCLEPEPALHDLHEELARKLDQYR